MSDPFDANLAALAERAPALAERVRHAAVGGDLELLAGKRGLPSVRVRRADGRWVALHSQYDPLREAERAAESLDLSKSRMAVAFGFGLGYPVEALWARWGTGLERVIVLEARLDLFALALRSRDLRPLLANPRISFEVASDALDVFAHLFDAVVALLTGSPVLVPHAPSMDLFPDWYEAAREQLLVATRMGVWSANTKIVLGRHAYTNVLNNYLDTAATPGVERILGKFSDVPAFVVAAGPSLDKNVEQLKAVGDRGLIVCVDTALRRLLAAGVRPHIVATIDPLRLTLRHFEGTQPPPETVLAFDIESLPEARGFFPGPKTVIWVRKSKLLCWMEEAIGGRGALEKGNTVAHTSFYLAEALGASPLIFVGQDLAYPRQPGVTHSSGTAFRSQWVWANEAKTHIIQPNHLRPGENEVVQMFWVPGVDGEPVPATPQLYAYLRQFERYLRGVDRPCIDATEGGARIQGTEPATLAECIARYCTRDAAVTQRLHEALSPPPDDRARAAAVLAQYRAELTEAAEQIQRGLAAAKRLLDLLERKDAGTTAVSQAVQELHRCHTEAYRKPSVSLTVEHANAAAAFGFLRSKQRSDAARDAAYWRAEAERFRALFEGTVDALQITRIVLDGIRIP